MARLTDCMMGESVNRTNQLINALISSSLFVCNTCIKSEHVNDGNILCRHMTTFVLYT